MKTKKIFFITVLVVMAFLAYAYNLPKLFKFDQKEALGEWQEKIFKNRVLYAVELEENNNNRSSGWLNAKSNNACSGLLYKIRFDPKKYPMISWKWKVIKFPEKTSYASALLPKESASIWRKLLAAIGPKPPAAEYKPAKLPDKEKDKKADGSKKTITQPGFT